MRSASKQNNTPSEDKDLKLLMEHPRRFVEINQPLISKMARYFVLKGFITEQEVEDLVQSINEKLLTDRIKKMQLQYNASVKLRIYFSKIVYNLCREILRAGRKEENIRYDSDFVEQSIASGRDVLTNLIIEDELERLSIVLRMSFKDKTKLLLLLKIISRIPLKKQDIKQYRPDLPDKDITELLNHLHKDYAELSNKELYERCQFLFNRNEHKSSSADSIRKWMDTRINDILYQMNKRGGEKGSVNYTKETLSVLIYKYFERDEGENSNSNQ